jgi:hypothetical protein
VKKNSGNAAKRRPDGMPFGRPFPKGVSGNPDGKPKGLRHSKTILRELLAIEEDVVDEFTGEKRRVNQLELILAKLVANAKKGEGFSIDRVLDRLEGKPEQSTKNVNTNLNVDATADELREVPDDMLKALEKVIKGSGAK